MVEFNLKMFIMKILLKAHLKQPKNPDIFKREQSNRAYYACFVLVVVVVLVLVVSTISFSSINRLVSPLSSFSSCSTYSFKIYYSFKYLL